MTVDLHSYRIICSDKAWKCRDRGHSEACYQRDPRLQTIADAPRCKHGNIDWHWILFDGLYTDERCDGAPELRALLDALAEKETDDG